MVQWHPAGEFAPPAVHLDEPTPNTCTTVVNGNVQFLLKIFLEIPCKLELHLDRNLAGDTVLLNYNAMQLKDMFYAYSGKFFLYP